MKQLELLTIPEDSKTNDDEFLGFADWEVDTAENLFDNTVKDSDDG